VFAESRSRLAAGGLSTWPEVLGKMTAHHSERPKKPFAHVVVDEAQDLGVAELKFLRALTPEAQDDLFFAGDLGQRIFAPPFSWKQLGVDVRGRSFTLRVCYRTSQPIRAAADRLLPAVLRDADGREEVRRGAISVFGGPAPGIERWPNADAEAAGVAAFIRAALDDGMAPAEIGIFVRSRAEMDRARTAVRLASLEPAEPGDRKAGDRHVQVGTMHLAKGLEFKAVAAMACDADVLPLKERIAAAVDETDLDEVYETERQLLYVACTRARDRLLVSGVEPASEFLDDLSGGAS
jgi:superfamily I DNA/RNA helicase